jgi:hypothetical protein
MAAYQSAVQDLTLETEFKNNFGRVQAGLWIRIHILRIRIQSLMLEANTDPDPNPDPDPIRIQGFNYQKLRKKITAENFFIFFDQKPQYTYP